MDGCRILANHSSVSAEMIMCKLFNVDSLTPEEPALDSEASHSHAHLQLLAVAAPLLPAKSRAHPTALSPDEAGLWLRARHLLSQAFSPGRSRRLALGCSSFDSESWVAGSVPTLRRGLPCLPPPHRLTPLVPGATAHFLELGWGAIKERTLTRAPRLLQLSLPWTVQVLTTPKSPESEAHQVCSPVPAPIHPTVSPATHLSPIIPLLIHLPSHSPIHPPPIHLPGHPQSTSSPIHHHPSVHPWTQPAF